MINENILKRVAKPGRYIGGEFGQIVKNKDDVRCRFAFCFPDTYEIGMSNLGIRILYGVLNQMPDVWCERAYCPWPDMVKEMQENNIPLWAHESEDPLADFDFVGFTLQYELCYTTVLAMLKMAGLPLLAKDRGEDCPIIIGGGPCAYNPEPIADFFDIFSIGEGEEALPELTRLYINMKDSGEYSREKFLREAAKLDGFYVPSLYEVSYNEDGTIASFVPKYDDVPATITKRIVEDMDKAFFPEKLVMPYIETVHDRIMLEVCRGCYRGCRFCQAGTTYRPVRRRSAEVLNEQAKKLFENTGYDEISLTSLSISDYPWLDALTDSLLCWTDEHHVGLSLPSLRADSFTRELMEKISSVRSSGLTFAPEAGTQRLRDVINKNVTEEEILNACRIAFDYGKDLVKLYFMSGLPTETEEDLLGIGELANHVIDAYYNNPNRKKGGRPPQVTVSVSCFIPKPFTPFQWEAQDSLERTIEKQEFMRKSISNRKIRFNWHDAKVSRIEAVFARGSRLLAPALIEAAERGMMLDAWDEYFSYENWIDVFEKVGIDPAFYAERAIPEDEILPWDMIDIGMTKRYLQSERKRAYEGVITPDCSKSCTGCGANKLGGEKTCCPKK
ncbi:MAG: TIGR03960 family B12-binding radical SAM protein [Clostridia bacterium]|nr:TIGR03960 family B12-binding radical SAM protein [Clostridia bacterium]